MDIPAITPMNPVERENPCLLMLQKTNINIDVSIGMNI